MLNLFRSKPEATPFPLSPLSVVILMALSGATAHGQVPGDKIRPAVSVPAGHFQPGEVRLLEGPYRTAMEVDSKWLLSLEPDRLLAWYRKEAGLEPRASNYEGWESQGIAGHSLGHYLSACARMHKAADDQRFLERVNYIVKELAVCQEANGDGFLGAMPNGKKVFAEVARGEIRSAGFDLNGSWVPWYNLHKVFAGLIDAYRYCGSKEALQVAARLGDWTIATTQNLNDAQWQKMLACEYGGMNEVLADLYAITGEKKYLQLAKQFYDRTVLDPLAAGRDELAGKHANTQVPKAVGVSRIFELTGENRYGAIARNFFHIVLTNHTYANGGNSDGEHFGPPGKLSNRLGVNTAETCNTYNMLKLASSLFTREPAAVYGDYAERALWNHILASQHPEDGRVIYYLSLRPGESKKFMDPHAFTCCSGTGMENHARHQDYIYYRNDDTLWIDQFIASEVTWTAKGLRVRQETRFPQEAATTLRFSTEKPVAGTVNIRHPFWATNGFAIRVNGKAVRTGSSPGSYVALDRRWKNRDRVEVSMPLPLRTESMPERADMMALFKGPILLAGNVGPAGSEDPVPVFVTENQPVQRWLKPSSTDALSFRSEGVGKPGDVALKPFYTVLDHRHAVYWNVFTPDAWRLREAEYKAEQERLRELEDRTVDLFRVGEMQPERDHNVQGEKTGPGEFAGRKFRHAWDGGWFSFEVAVPKDAPADLVITYWGSETGRRTFDVLIEGEKVATTSLHQDKPEHFWDKSYPLPENLTRGKEKVTVRFQAHPQNYAGGIFGVRVVRRN
jgi:uncharacterized protein